MKVKVERREGETVTLVFGRFNPPTVGHEKLLNGSHNKLLMVT